MSVRVDLSGGPAAGRRLTLTADDVLPSILVGMLDGVPVLLGTHPDPKVVGRVRDEHAERLKAAAAAEAAGDRDAFPPPDPWTTYYLWPRTDPDRLLQYRTDRPPRSARAGFSASA